MRMRMWGLGVSGLGVRVRVKESGLRFRVKG
jgi:hypothetical protein